ncbi:NAD-dependent epimerase/dehydratase family protein [Cryptosporangium arvum]|uniref:NAD-dependent epimerase/dehydratase family protein n=1 Tax=Cryptosporangium arvum TaxID=80871 RepID=UPI0004AE6AB2|nr:NAD(P)-dependent oxidoreductase [Cryptosporangium arvum]
MILVTGGRGFIGSHTVAALRDLGAECLPAGRAQADCTELDALRALGEKYPITGIVHLAAVHLSSVPVADELRANLAATLNVAAVAAEWGVGRVVFASTIGVYGGVPGPVWREDAPLPPGAPFAVPASKRASEILAPLAVDGAVHARIGAIWGPGGRPSSPFMAVPALVHAAVHGTPAPDAYADDAIDLGYARDCGRALALLATAPSLRHTIYNVSGGVAVTNARFAEALRTAVPEAAVALRPGPRPAAARLDISRLTGDTGYRPAFGLDAAVADYVEWLRAGNSR